MQKTATDEKLKTAIEKHITETRIHNTGYTVLYVKLSKFLRRCIIKILINRKENGIRKLIPFNSDAKILNKITL
ncbi:ferritin-like domain-containing protein [Chryseobacterium potabilaquae]|uniref:Uncharacterized protein n=1 Tax=Chryseobacterium potabilaquae TaxID=2675057 RepID=A0A6N4X6M3_9FLAO|nr:ferritin-like domain-containing protein [Chryseobacterium potabilaquae]CAA7196698.1 hypothetical protein CHRY9293_02774 [Chryseobacterium potabilaquae]